jgi:hypothetical protein
MNHVTGPHGKLLFGLVLTDLGKTIMVEKWSGDGTYYLPARQIGPYRLWFEFLKKAHTDPDIDVDYKHYEEWGNFYEMEFSEWWSGATWRSLFAVDAGVRVLDDSEQFKNDDQGIVVRLPLGKDPKETIKDVNQLLSQHGAGTNLDTIVQGKFALSPGYEKAFLKYLDRANFMLRLYGMWLNNAEHDLKDRVGRTAVEFSTWAKERTEMIESRGYNYKKPVAPFAVDAFADEFERGLDTSTSDERRQFMRYLKKARNLAGNAAMGVFPGKY